ncbi:hypothetical protein BGX24_009188 [Mortierella sp. AD032]|nr:hypothetical protein BGX24_009188 [Mortierella sp. AD032]
MAMATTSTTTTSNLQQQQAREEYSEFVAAEGRYELLQDFHLDHVLPHPVIPTYVSSVSVKYKDYLNSSSSGGWKKGGGGVFGTVFDSLDEQLRDLKFSDDRAADDAEEAAAVVTAGAAPGLGSSHSGGGGLQLSGNFHGNLVDLPIYNEETSPVSGGAGKSPGGSASVTPPGPPPLKDSTSFGRLSDFSSFTSTSHSNLVSGVHNNSSSNTTISSRTLGRASSFSHQLYEEGSGGAMGYQGGGGLTHSATIGPSSSTSSAAGFSFFTGKRKKPKSNIGKTNSTFVAKITTNENLAKILASRVNEDVYLFWNTGRTFTWSDLGQKPNEPLSHISFSKAFPTAHDVNILTRSCDHLDVIIGFSTGDIIWFNPLSNKYSRLNKQAIIKDSAVTMIKWLPGSESQFMVAFQDGSIVMMDKDKDDGAFSTPTPPEENSKKPINAFAFSPDLQHVAVVAADGELRIIDFRNERLIETFSSYFGALSCVCWSPDGKYILTGGQDDLVTIWSFKDLRIVARCQGHQNYVTGVAFDSWRCDERNYRFGSVGEDAKLLLWDFSVGSLHKPKAAATQRRGSNTTVHGTGAFKPGHASKGSITSLRGIGGHSLFNSSHNNRSSLSQQLSAPSAGAGSGVASETASIDNASVLSALESASGREWSTLGASTTELSVVSLSTEGGGGGLSVSGDTASLNSFTDSTSTSTTTATTTTMAAEGGTSSNISTGSSSKPPRKALQHAARSLPHLHFHRSTHHSSNTTAANSAAVPQQQSHQNSLSTMFHHPNTNNNRRKSEDATTVTTRGSVDAERDGEGQVVTVARPPERRSRVAMLQPLMATVIHREPLASITFREDAILTSDRRGHIKVWKRPMPPPPPPVVVHS